MQCFYCGSEQDLVRLYGTSGGEGDVHTCRRCERAHCRDCRACGIPVDVNCLIHGYCPDCNHGEGVNSTTCVECGEEVPHSRSALTQSFRVLNFDADYRLAHTNCLLGSGAYVQCAYCGRVHLEDDDCECGEPDDEPEGVDFSHTIHDYSYTPALVFHTLPLACDELFLGIELEITPRVHSRENECAALNCLPAFVYNKHDSSIPEGFEIVTHPLSVGWIKNNIHELVSTFSELTRLGYISGESGCCGMHIHMSRRAFAPLSLYKFMYSIYHNPSLIMLLSQRHGQSMDTYASLSDSIGGIRKRVKAGNQLHRSRHDAVNISTKPTIELRVFNGTLNPLVFMKNIDVAVFLYNFAHDASLQHLTLVDLMAYLNQNESLYPYLSLFLGSPKHLRAELFDHDAGPQSLVGEIHLKRVEYLYELATDTSLGGG